MTPRQMQAAKDWLPFALMLATGVAAWTTLRRDVSESVRVPRFEAESIRVHQQLQTDRLRLQTLEQQAQTLEDICRAVRCRPR